MSNRWSAAARPGRGTSEFAISEAQAVLAEAEVALLGVARRLRRAGLVASAAGVEHCLERMELEKGELDLTLLSWRARGKSVNRTA